MYGCGGSTYSTDDTSGEDSIYESSRSIDVYFSQTSGGYSGGVDELIVSDIENATNSIYLAIYDMTNDKFRDALIDAYESGVKVEIMTDDDHKDDEDIVALKDAGIKVYDDEKSALMHDKFLVLDGKIVWSGSANYTYYAFYRNNENLVKITDSDVAKFYKKEFDELISHSLKPLVYSSSNLLIYFSPEDDFQTKLISLIDSAKQNIYFMIYAFTDKNVADALIRAKKRGVEVKGIFDEGFNSNQYSKYEYLKDAGVDVKVDGNSFRLHDKVMMFDGNTVVTGSYNFTISANEDNSENSLVIKDEDIYQKYQNEFFKIYQEGKNLP